MTYFGGWQPMSEKDAVEHGDDVPWGSLSAARGGTIRTRKRRKKQVT